MSLIANSLEQKANAYVKYAHNRQYDRLLIETEIVKWISDLLDDGTIIWVRQYGWKNSSPNTYEFDYRPADDRFFQARLWMTFPHLSTMHSTSPGTSAPVIDTNVEKDDAYDRAMRGI